VAKGRGDYLEPARALRAEIAAAAGEKHADTPPAG